ncbi:MAG: MerR family transcriptional regulator [SAR202 cluster bacterium]|nr:MerR family transcriptional regulator [SAR202 cluster bacterium]
MRPSDMEGIYVISVAARILEMHPQTLRKYERVGFVSPSRTGGKLRLYSEQDIVRLRLIKHLTSELGLNIAGVQLALALFNQMLKMKVQLDRLQGPALKRALNQSLDEMYEMMQA